MDFFAWSKNINNSKKQLKYGEEWKIIKDPITNTVFTKFLSRKSEITNEKPYKNFVNNRNVKWSKKLQIILFIKSK